MTLMTGEKVISEVVRSMRVAAGQALALAATVKSAGGWRATRELRQVFRCTPAEPCGNRRLCHRCGSLVDRAQREIHIDRGQPEINPYTGEPVEAFQGEDEPG
jgi:hypothetical protein